MNRFARRRSHKTDVNPLLSRRRELSWRREKGRTPPPASPRASTQIVLSSPGAGLERHTPDQMRPGKCANSRLIPRALISPASVPGYFSRRAWHPFHPMSRCVERCRNKTRSTVTCCILSAAGRFPRPPTQRITAEGPPCPPAEHQLRPGARPSKRYGPASRRQSQCSQSGS